MFRAKQKLGKYRIEKRLGEGGFAAVYKAEYGMTRPDWRVLANLGQYGRQSARQICARAGMHKTEVSRAVARLDPEKIATDVIPEEDSRE